MATRIDGLMRTVASRHPKLAGLLAVVTLGFGTSIAHAAAIHHWTFDDTILGDKKAYFDKVGSKPATPANKDRITFFAGDAPFGKAISFDGQQGAYLTIPKLTAIQKNSFTVAVWVNVTTVGPNFVLADWQDFQHAGFVFGLESLQRGGASAIVDLRSTQTNPQGERVIMARANPAKLVPLNEWHHLAWVWDRTTDPARGTVTAYLDGTVIGTGRQVRAVTSPDIAMNDREMRIGGREFLDRGYTGAFNGAMDELWIFNEPLKAEQVKFLMEHNNIVGTGPLAKVLVKKDEVVAAGAAPPNPAPAKPDPPKPAVQNTPPATPPVTPPITPVTPPVTPSTTPPTPTPTVTTPPKPDPVVAATPPEPKSEPAKTTESAAAPVTAGSGGEPTPRVSVSEFRDRPANDRGALSMGPDVLSNSAPGDGGARAAGIITCLTMMTILSSFLVWAFKERAKMRAAGRL